MKYLTPKEYAALYKCTPQNITKKIRKLSLYTDEDKKKEYFKKVFPDVKEIVNKHIRCVLLILK